MEKLKRFLEKKISSQRPKKELIGYLCMLLKSDFTLYKYTSTIVQKYVDPFARIIEQGVNEGIFQVEFPLESCNVSTAKYVLR